MTDIEMFHEWVKTAEDLDSSPTLPAAYKRIVRSVVVGSRRAKEQLGMVKPKNQLRNEARKYRQRLMNLRSRVKHK